MFESSDEQLVKKAINGNKGAWFSLLSRHEKAIYNYAYRMTGNTHDAADLMQEVFLSVFNSLGSFNASGSFKSWMFRIAHFKAMDFFRRKRPDVSFNDSGIAEDKFHYQHQSDDEQKSALSPENHIESRQSQQQILKMMQCLPLKQRLVIELKFFSQFTFDEIAEQLDVSSNTAKSRLYAALAVLRNKMKSENTYE